MQARWWEVVGTRGENLLWEMPPPGELDGVSCTRVLGCRNLRSPDFLPVLEKFIPGTRTEVCFFSMLLLGIPLDFLSKNNKMLQRKIHERSFCSEAEKEWADQEAPSRQEVCVPPGFPLSTSSGTKRGSPSSDQTPSSWPCRFGGQGGQGRCSSGCPRGNMKLHPRAGGVIIGSRVLCAWVWQQFLSAQSLSV